ncbi:hypothetical protein [Granulicella sp. L60]|uniref:hypothetical protein n=1 Tax=Granulicella sp. L60 TaxID=1641866 RepID=UPI00131A680E|nr:hypothetical protein [Granulicella sp. L60]
MRARSNPLDLLDWEELEQAPNTLGAFSFLNTPREVIDIDAHRPGSFASNRDKTSTVDKTTTVNAPQLERIRRYRIHKCHLAQDAHSHGENQLYLALWGSAHTETAETRIVTVGWDRMARKARMSDKAAKRNLIQLMSKLAVELIAPEDSSARQGRTYRIYSFKATIERRNRAGLNYVIRDKGVRFVMNPDQIEELTLDHKTSTVDKLSTVDITTTGTVDKTSGDTMDKTYTPLGSSLGKELGTTSSTQDEVSQIVQALSRYVLTDDEAARLLIRNCREMCPDAQIEEIVIIISEKALPIVRNRAIKNPMGMLLTAIPRCFESASIAALRRQIAVETECIRKREEDAQRQQEEMQRWLSRN